MKAVISVEGGIPHDFYAFPKSPPCPVTFLRYNLKLAKIDPVVFGVAMLGNGRPHVQFLNILHMLIHTDGSLSACFANVYFRTI